MRFNLRSLAKRARPGLARSRRTLVLREITPTRVQVGNLERLYARIVRRWWEGCRDQLLPAYRSALERDTARRQSGAIMDDDGLFGAMASIAQEVDRLVIELTPELQSWVVAVESWHRQRWAASLTPSGVNLRTLISVDDVQATIETVVQQNVSLVRNVSETTRRRIEQVIFQGFQQRLQATEIARQLSAAVGIERRRATLIAVDQTQKLSAQLDTERMRQAGIDEFQWVHSGKIHYRPWHLQRNGQRFALEGEIPPEDMPGVPIYCGCKKRAVLTLAD